MRECHPAVECGVAVPARIKLPVLSPVEGGGRSPLQERLGAL